MPWAKQRLEEVLVGLELAAGAEGRARVTQLKVRSWAACRVLELEF